MKEGRGEQGGRERRKLSATERERGSEEGRGIKRGDLVVHRHA